MKRYKFNYTEYLKMKEDQDSRCEICGLHDLDYTKRLSIDHCHKTNKIRGLLCQKCNWLLGLTNDNKELLQNMLMYLDKPLTRFDYEGPYRFSCKQSNIDKAARIKRKMSDNI